MRYLFVILIVLLFSSPGLLNAQTDVFISKKDFKAGKTGFDEAWKHVKTGDTYFALKGTWYGKAFDEYLKAYQYNSNTPELNYKLGATALFSDNKDKAAQYFKKALELNSNLTDDILLLAGRSLQFTGMYSEAIEMYDRYIYSLERESDPGILNAKKYIEECNSALRLPYDTTHVKIVNAGSNINSDADDYSEIISADGLSLYFASRRKLQKSSNFYSDSKYDENIFVSARSGVEWGESLLAGKSLTTPYCEAPLFINRGSDSLFIYAGYENGGDIKLSVKKKGNWKEPGELKSGINSRDNETSFTISPSGREIYFVTTHGNDNVGGKDIYYIEKTGNNKWTSPKNAGMVINTVYDEESVCFSPSGDTLWFSSKGHNSAGGFDIFYSIRNNEGVWGSAENIGFPVNTPFDDSFYQITTDKPDTFYFVSNRPGGSGGLDIYIGHKLPVDPEPVPDRGSAGVQDR